MNIVHISIIHNSPTLEATQISLGGIMEKWTVVYSHKTKKLDSIETPQYMECQQVNFKKHNSELKEPDAKNV